MRIEHLEYIVEIAHYKSITKAARHLYITQPSLSGVVSSIERELGYPLFKRTKQGVVPTAKGQAVIDDAKGIIEAWRRWQEPDSDAADISGDVHVVVTTGVCGTFLVDIIAELWEKYPLIDIHLDVVKKLVFFDHMQNGKANIGLSSFIPAERDMYEDMLKQNNWQMDILFEDIHHCIISTQNPKSQQPQLTYEDLKDMVFATFTDIADRTTEIIINFLPPETKQLRVNSTSVIYQLVSKDMAVSISPTSGLYGNYYLSHGMIKQINLEGFQHSAFHNIIYPDEKHLSKAEQKFLECVRSYYERLDAIEDE